MKLLLQQDEIRKRRDAREIAKSLPDRVYLRFGSVLVLVFYAGSVAFAGEVWNGSNLTIYGNNVQKSRIGPVLISIFNFDG